jgi:hypothetical protein
MTFFSRSDPILIDPKILKKIEKNIPQIIIPQNQTIYLFYKNYLENNLLCIIFIFIIIIFLVYKYYSKDISKIQNKKHKFPIPIYSTQKNKYEEKDHINILNPLGFNDNFNEIEKKYKNAVLYDYRNNQYLQELSEKEYLFTDTF